MSVNQICRLLLSVFFILVYPVTAASELSALLPDQPSSGLWQAGEAPEYYSPATLYEYINGEAELYHRYGFVRLVTQTYYYRNAEDTSITVNIYEMETLDHAFGIYASYRYPEYQFEEIGVEAMVSDYGIKFYQDRYFVDISGWDAGVLYDEGMRFLAGLISEKIGGDRQPPDMVRLLPETHRQAKSIQFFTTEMLNQSFLGGGVGARYQIGEDDGYGFIIFPNPDLPAETAIRRIQSVYLDLGDSLITPDESECGLIMKNGRNQYLVLKPEKEFIVGARGFKSLENCQILIREIGKGLDVPD